MTRVRPTVDGVAVTAFLTLYQRWQDNRRPTPLLSDRWPDELVPRLDFDFDQFRQMGPFGGYSLTALRTRLMDDWVGGYLADHPDAVAVDLGAGLDSRVFRVDPAPGHEWYDVDLPAVTDLATRLLPPRPGHTRVAADVRDDGWLGTIPRDRPAVVVGDGLFGFLDAGEAAELFGRLVDRLPTGVIVFNSYSPMVLRKRQPVFDRYGVRVRWTIDEPADVSRLEPRLRYAEERSQFRDPLLARTSRACRAMCALIRLSRAATYSTRILRFDF